MRYLVRKLLRGKVKKTSSILALIGCTPSDLRLHIERTMLPWMTWENYGRLWHVDHIRPCASFDLSIVEDQKTCFNFSNLCALPALENKRKNDKLSNGSLGRHIRKGRKL